MHIFNWNNFIETAQTVLDAEEALWTTSSEICFASCYSPAESVGSGEFEYHQWSDGLNIMIATCKVSRPVSMKVKDGSCLRLNFALSLDMLFGKGDLVDPELNQKVWKGLSWRIVNTPEVTEIIETWPADVNNVYVTIHCSSNLLADFAGVPAEDLPEIFQKPAKDKPLNDCISVFESGPPMTEATARLHCCSLKDNLRVQYFRSQAIALICLAIQQMSETQKVSSPISVSAAERQKISEIVEFIDADIRNFVSTAQICNLFAMNKNKVNQGFKDEFGLSLSGYVESKRLEKAYEYLTRSDIRIGEISDKIGMLHQSSFSTAIKRRFGHSPSNLRASAAKTLEQ